MTLSCCYWLAARLLQRLLLWVAVGLLLLFAFGLLPRSVTR